MVWILKSMRLESPHHSISLSKCWDLNRPYTDDSTGRRRYEYSRDRIAEWDELKRTRFVMVRTEDRWLWLTLNKHPLLFLPLSLSLSPPSLSLPPFSVEETSKVQKQGCLHNGTSLSHKEEREYSQGCLQGNTVFSHQ